MGTDVPRDRTRKHGDQFDDRAVARGLEVFQSTMPPSIPPDEVGKLRVLMHAGTAKTSQQLEQKLGASAQVLRDDRGAGNALDGLLALAGGISTLQTRAVALIDARWVSDEQLERWHRAYPLVPLVIVARDEGIPTLRALAAGVARGCVTPASTVDQLAEAVDAVSRGELWMPRSLVPYLYACMLAHTASIREEPAAADADTADGAMPMSNLDLLNEAALTPREIAAIELARTGYTNKEIAKTLGISDNTVKKHLSNAFDKLGIHRRRQLY
jgi:DNA-binding NarL/FixJ family response regulator